MHVIRFLSIFGTVLPLASSQSAGGSVIIPDSRIGENSTSPGGDTFTGGAWVDDVYRDDDGTITTVAFEPGARTFWHRHEGGQVLRVLAGTGWIADEGGTPTRIHTGDTIWCRENTTHWHGADVGSYLVHLAISRGSTEWLEEVKEEEYRIK